jgi:hypothetical protein
MKQVKDVNLYILAHEALFWLRRLYSLDNPEVLRAMLDTAPPCEDFLRKFADSLKE